MLIAVTVCTFALIVDLRDEAPRTESWIVCTSGSALLFFLKLRAFFGQVLG